MDAQILFKGVEELLEGILTPLAVSFFASLARVGLWGWPGTGAYFGDLFVGCFAGVCASWLLQLAEFPLTVDAVIISMAALSSKRIFIFIFSRRFMTAIGDAVLSRLRREILHRGAPDAQSQAREKDFE